MSAALVPQGGVAPYLLLASLFREKTVKSEEIKSTLQIVKVIGDLAQEALRAFLEGYLSQFDPSVGENACEIRAVKICYLFRSLPRIRVEDALKTIQGTLDQINIRAFECSQRFFEENPAIDFPLDSDTAFIVQAYILARTKVETMKEDGFTIVEKNLPDIFVRREITKSGGTRLINIIQWQLARASVQFVQEQAVQLGPEDRRLAEVVTGEFVKEDSYKRKVTPFLFFVEVVFKSLCSTQGRVILKIKKIIAKREGAFTIVGIDALLFKGEGEDFSPISQPTEADRKEPAVIVEGNCVLKEEDNPDFERGKRTLLEQGIMKVMLMNAAAHFQYSGDFKNRVKEFEEMLRPTGFLPHYLELKQAAQELGCALENRSLFCIDHVFCDLVKNQMGSV